jgi:hypothetical protein
VKPPLFDIVVLLLVVVLPVVLIAAFCGHEEDI